MHTTPDRTESSDARFCPQCGQPLVHVGAFVICPAHGQISEPRPSSPLRIFLSYGHDANEELVRRIKSDLELRGHDVWFDKTEIKVGDDWRRAITDGIVRSQRVVSFLSKHSTRDPGVCRDEIAIAIGVKGGNIQTILVESESEVQPPVNIGHIQWLDMHDWQQRRSGGEEQWEQWYQDRFAEILRVVESDESRRFAGEIETLHPHLKPIRSDARIYDLLRKGFFGRQWLFEAVEKWRQDASGGSRLFWITGDPGVGKSAFAAQLTHTRPDAVIAAQFVEWDKPDHRDARRVICSLAFQLASRLPDYRKLLLTLPEIANLDRKEPAELFDYLLANPLRSVIGGGRGQYLVVIDALDEAGVDGRNTLVEMLASHAPRLPDWLGLVVTSRPEYAVRTPLQGLNPFVLDTRSEANRTDLRDYLSRQLGPQLLDRPDADRLIGMILDKSEGVFLYVERFCDDVKQRLLSLHRPEQFPQGLGGIFHQWFQRQFPDLQRFRKDVRPALRAILAAREPLPLEILQRVLNWQDEELSDFTRMLGSLFPVARGATDEVIKPCHKSLADWLARKPKAGQYYVSVLEGHRTLAEAGWQQYCSAETEVGSYFCAHLARHMAEVEHYGRLLDLVTDEEIGLFYRWVEMGFTADGRYCLERLLSALRGAPVPKGVFAALATQLARIELREGLLDRASERLREALQVAGTDSPKRILAVAAHEYGSVHFEQRATVEARGWYRTSLRIARSATPALEREIAANLLAIAMTYQVTHPACERVNRLALHALKLAQGSGDLPHELEAMRLLADVNKDKMDFLSAERYLSNALEKASDSGLPFATMSLLTVKGWLSYQRAALVGKDPAAALDAFRELLETSRIQGQIRFEADAYCGIGQCSLMAGDLDLAQDTVRWLEELRGHSMHGHVSVRRLILKASLLHRHGEYEAAFVAFRRSLSQAQEAGILARQADAEVGCGAAMRCQGDLAKADEHWQHATALSERCSKIRQAIILRSIALMRANPDATPL